MTEAPSRPGFPAVLALLIVGAAVYMIPALFRDPGFVDLVDGPVRGAAAGPMRPGEAVLSGPSTDAGTAALVDRFFPVAVLSFRLDHRWADVVALPGVMRQHSAFLHVLAAVALLFLLVRLRLARIPAFVGATLFLVHPSVLETVSVVAFRPAILTGLFGFLALWAVAAWCSSRRAILAVAACGAAAIAAASHPAAVVLPLLGWIVVRHVGSAGSRPAGLFAMGLLAAPVALVVGGVLLAHPGIAAKTLPAEFDPARCLDPVLALFWTRSPAMVLGPAAGTSTLAGVLALTVLGLWIAAAVLLHRRRSPFAVGAGFVAVASLTALVLGRREPDLATYLAIAGLGLTVAAAPLPRRATVVVGAVAMILCSVLSIRMGGRYESGPRLWRLGADRSPVAATLLAAELAMSKLDPQRDEALALLERALPELPPGPDRLCALETKVRVLSRLGRPGEASRAAERMCAAAERLGDRVTTERLFGLYLHAAECFTVEDSREKTDEYFAKARRIAPEHPSVIAAEAERRFAVLVAAVREERRDENADLKPGWLSEDEPRLVPIEATLNKARARDPRCFRALILTGRISEATGGVLQAVPSYEAAIAVRPDRVEPRILLATLYAGNNLAEAAEQCVQKALLDGLDDPALHYLLANIYAASGRRGDARRYLEFYLANRPGNRSARVLLANLLAAEALAAGDRLGVPELQKYANRIRELNPDDPKGYVVQAAVLCKDKSRRFVEAIVLLEKAQRAMPNDADVQRRLACAHRDYGWLLTWNQKREMAMDHFQTFLALAPKGVSTGAVRNAISAHCKKLEQKGIDGLVGGDVPTAEASFRRLLKLRPDRPEAHYQLGIAYFFQDKFELARKEFETALRLGRAQRIDVSHYVFRLLETLQRMGRSDEAKRRGEEFLARPGEADALMLAKIRQLLQ